MNEIKYSFIITTINRYELLKRCINSIRIAYGKSKKKFKYDIFLVLQSNSKINKETHNKNYDELLKIEEIKVVYCEPKGLSNARNIGIKNSTGDVLIFIDDDATVSNDFFIALDKCIDKYPHIGVFCGSLLEEDTNRPYGKQFTKTEKFYLKHKDFVYFMGSNHMVRRKIFEKYGNYDDLFGAGAKYHSAEETEFFFRLLYKKEKILYLPEVKFYHPSSSHFSLEKKYRYRIGYGAVHAKAILYYGNLFDYYSTFFKPFCGYILKLLFHILTRKNFLEDYYILKGTITGFYQYIKIERQYENRN